MSDNGRQANPQAPLESSPGPSPIATIWRAASALWSRSRFAQDAGMAFDGLRDYDTSLGYNPAPTVYNYRERYNRWGIAKRIVEAFPQATWSTAARITEDPDPNATTKFEMEVDDLFTQHRLWQRFLRADILAGLGRYAVVLIGAPGELADPLPQMTADEVLYFQPLAEDRVDAIVFDAEVTSPRYGLPETYNLNIGTEETVISPIAVSRTASTIRTVHWSRVIHIADGLLDDDVFGTPRLRSVWNYLDDLMKVVGGGAEAAWKRADPGLNLKLDKDVKFDSDEAESLQSEVEDYIHGLTRVIRTRGVDMNLLEAQVSPFQGNATALISLIAATTRIPQRILLGSERGELSSNQDRNNWNERVGERQHSYAEPLVRDLVDRLGSRGVWTLPKHYDVIWPEPKPNEGENASLVQTLASANQAQFQSEGVIVTTANEMRENILRLDPLEEVLDLDDMPPPPTPPSADGGEEGEGEGEGDGTTQLARIKVTAEQRAVRDAVMAASVHHMPELDALMLETFEAVQNDVDLDALEEALENNDIPTATAILSTAWGVVYETPEDGQSLDGAED